MNYFISRPDGRIAYDDTGGEGPLIVCVPGMGDTRKSFRFIAPALADNGNRVVTMDLRGHGESDATFGAYSPDLIGADIVALLQHLKAGPAYLLGVSIGSDAAPWAATEAPELVKGLMLVRAYPPGQALPFMQRMLVKVLLARPWAALAWSKVFASFFPTSPPSDLAAYQRQLRTMLREPGRADALRRMANSSKDLVHARMPQVSQPALVVMGAADQGDPQQDGQSVADAVSGQLVLIDKAGHYPHVEAPEPTLRALVAFQNEVNHA